jgi:adenylosuccinate synthase
MMINPLNAFVEAKHLQEVGIKDPFSLLTVDTRAMVLTPFHKALNRLREMSRDQRHGSTGEGIGEGRIHQSKAGWEKVLRAGHLIDGGITRHGLNELHYYAKATLAEFKEPSKRDSERWGQAMEVILRPKLSEWVEAYREFARAITITDAHPLTILKQYQDVIFEGAQGVLLDEQHGFHPHTTWSKTTRVNAFDLLAGSGADVKVLGVLRSYTTRHGDGPFVTEDFHLTRDIPEPHNGTGTWQGAWRNGHLDLPVLRYALSVSDADALAVTHMDRVPADGMPVCTSYTITKYGHDTGIPGDYYLNGRDTFLLDSNATVYCPVLTDVSKAAYIDTIEKHLSKPVALVSYGPTAHETRVRERSFFKEVSHV